MKLDEKLVHQLITPDWPAPCTVRSLVTTRKLGASEPPFNSFNLALHVGDNAHQVQSNRQWLKDQFELQQIQWLEQVHGVHTVEASHELLVIPKADAVFTNQTKLACAIMTADCLPVLVCSKQGGWVGAAHAGWRGLAAGVLKQLVGCYPGVRESLMVWLGPAIGPERFEVGSEVKLAFKSLGENADAAFKPSKRSGHYLANLYLLAELQLKQLGISDIYGGDYCTYSDQQLFYSYRRSPQTGRMASLIWLEENKIA